MRRYTVFFFAIVVLVLAFLDKGQITGDGAIRWNALVHLIENHQLTPDKYSIIQPIFAASLYLAADLWMSLSQDDNAPDSRRIRIIRNVVQRFNKFVTLFLAILFYRVLRSLFEFDQRKALLGTLFLLFASMLIPNAHDFYSECLGSLLLLTTLLSLVGLCADPHHARTFSNAAMLILSMSLLIGLTPIACIPLGLILIFLAASRFFKSDTSIVRTNIAVALGVIAWILGVSIVLGENFIRRENILDFGYPGEGFQTPLTVGLPGLLVSPARGILFFIPTFFFGILVLLRRKDIQCTSGGLLFVSLSLVYSVSLLLVYSKWHDWHGGWYWGPRYLLPLSVFGALYFAICGFKFWHKMNPRQKGVYIIIGLLSASLYKVGVTINMKHLMKCLETDPLGKGCFWDFAYLPYSSLFDLSDLRNMIVHRSTVVEVVAAVLFLLLFLRTQLKNVNAAS